MKADAKRDAATHPHSGIATVSVVLDGAVQYAETTGSKGVLRAGSVEWMRAGGGVWHTGTALPGPVRAFQLWVALPEYLENAPIRAATSTPPTSPRPVPFASSSAPIRGSAA